MKLTTNDEFTVVDFEDGKLLTNAIDLQSYYVDLESFEIIHRCKGNILDIKELNFHGYFERDLLDFINYLVEKNILIIIKGGDEYENQT